MSVFHQLVAGNSGSGPGSGPPGCAKAAVAERSESARRIGALRAVFLFMVKDKYTASERGGTEAARARALKVHALPEEGAPWTDSSRERTLAVHARTLK